MTHRLKPVAAAMLLGLSTQLFAAGCSGHLVFGDLDTGVADRAVGEACLSELIDATPNTWGNHGQFVSHVARTTLKREVRRTLNHRERARLVKAAAHSDIGKTLEVKIITMGDFHGNLRPTGTRTIDGATFDRGGAEYVSAVVKEKLTAYPNTAFVHAGDLIGASPLLSALFHDEPTIEAMNEMGLMVNAVGNHEFDEGREELLRMQYGNQLGGNGCHPTDGCQDGDDFGGADFQFLAANVVDTASGKTLFPAYKIMNFKGNKVAFIGMTLENTPAIVTPSGVAGLSFKDEADTVNALVPHLRRHGVKGIVVVVHEGGFATGGSNACEGVSGPIVDIVARLDDAVDAVITGHTHQAYICQLPNAAGRDILVTAGSPYGRFLTDITLTLDTKKKDVIATAAENTELLFEQGVAPKDAAITALIDKYDALAAPLENRVIGHNADVLSRTANAAGESVLGDVIADAQYNATRDAGFGDAVVAFMNPGGIRADIGYAQIGSEGDGNITYGEGFTVQPFGNSLVTMTLTGAQIETLLEQQFMGCTNNQPFNRIMQVSDGFSYTWDANGPACDKVNPASITLNGAPVDLSASYRVTVNSFLADGGDNFSVLAEGTDRLGGAQDVDALEAWFNTYGVVDPVTYPTALQRIQRLN